MLKKNAICKYCKENIIKKICKYLKIVKKIINGINQRPFIDVDTSNFWNIYYSIHIIIKIRAHARASACVYVCIKGAIIVKKA